MIACAQAPVITLIGETDYISSCFAAEGATPNHLHPIAHSIPDSITGHWACQESSRPSCVNLVTDASQYGEAGVIDTSRPQKISSYLAA